MTPAIVWVLSVYVLRNCFRSRRKRSCRRSLTRDPTVIWHFFSGESACISAQTLFCRSPLDIPSRKQNITRNSHSRLFKVKRFGIAEKPTTDSVSLYINAGLISKFSEEIASKNAENCRYSQLHCRLTPPPQGTPRISASTLYCQ